VKGDRHVRMIFFSMIGIGLNVCMQCMYVCNACVFLGLCGCRDGWLKGCGLKGGSLTFKVFPDPHENSVARNNTVIHFHFFVLRKSLKEQQSEEQ
jgi:hypothetical protein